MILMLQARYSIGVNRVSALQYNEESLKEAAAKVKVTEMQDATDFALVGLQVAPAVIGAKPEGLRQRKQQHHAEISDRLQELDVDDKSGDGRDEKSTHHAITDPLKWFGVLVPQSLRQSQGCFKSVIDKCCHVASLKASLIVLRGKHTELMHKKKQLGPRNVCDIFLELSDSESVDSCDGK